MQLNWVVDRLLQRAVSEAVELLVQKESWSLGMVFPAWQSAVTCGIPDTPQTLFVCNIWPG